MRLPCNRPVSAHIYGNTIRDFTLNGIDLKSNSRDVQIHHNIFEQQVPATAAYRPGSQLATRANEGTISSKGTGHRIADNIFGHLVDAGPGIFRTSEDGGHRIVNNVIMGVDKTSFAIAVWTNALVAAPPRSRRTPSVICQPTESLENSGIIKIYNNPGILGGAPLSQCNAEITRILAERNGSIRLWVAAGSGRVSQAAYGSRDRFPSLRREVIWGPRRRWQYLGPRQHRWGDSLSLYGSRSWHLCVWGRVLVSGGDSFFVEMDDNAPLLWSTKHGEGNWVWDQVHEGSTAPVRFTLTTGTHTLRIKQREDGTKLDQILITNDLSYTPK